MKFQIGVFWNVKPFIIVENIFSSTPNTRFIKQLTDWQRIITVRNSHSIFLLF
jgi:hypothetical protein